MKMIRENYILFWGLFFAVTAIGGLGVIACLALIARYLNGIGKGLSLIFRELSKDE